MRIGILTFVGAPNSGALLQAYALRKTLIKMGHDVEFIDYRPDYAGWQPWRNLGIQSLTFHRAIPRRILFNSFRKHYLPSTPILRSNSEMSSAIERYDAVVVGSDQVWSGNVFARFDPAYFLDFVPENKYRKISYAACFGQQTQPPETMRQCGALLRRFHHISVRSAISHELVKSLAERDASIVGDPTILHDFAEFSSQSPATRNYVLAYSLSPNKRTTGERIVKCIRTHMNLPVVTVWPTEGFPDSDQRIEVLGPANWVRLFKNASAVCTDSFHGSVFAIKFHKPIFAWEGSSPSRLRDLMEQCGLTERFLAADDKTPPERLAERTIDWAKADAGIADLKSKAVTFLEQALGSK